MKGDLFRLVISGVLLLVSLTSFAPPAGAAPFDDVPAGHWAYGALEQLSSVGLIDGYPPGFFSGSRRLTRYEMALSLAGALGRLASASDLPPAAAEDVLLEELVAAYNEQDVRRALSASQVQLLRTVTAEFSPELEMLGHRPPKVRMSPARNLEQWQLDAAVEGPARDMLQGSGTPADRWSGSGSRSDTIQPALRLGGGPFRSGSLSTADDASAHPIASIGGTVFFVGEGSVAGPSRSAAPALDGTIHLSSSGPAVEREGDSVLGPWQATETRAGEVDMALGDNVSLSGTRTQRTIGQGDFVSTQVKAQVMWGDVSIDGKLRSVEPERMFRFDDEGSPGGEDSIGLGLSVRLGDVLLSTGQDMVGSGDEQRELVRSLTLEYSLAEAATVTAGWRSVSDTREQRTSVDVSVPVPLGSLRFGLAYEQKQEDPSAAISLTTLTMAGLDLKLWDNAEARAAVALRGAGPESGSTTSLGLKYTLHPEAALLLGYKFIDFREAEKSRNVATAEFSIRF